MEKSQPSIQLQQPNRLKQFDQFKKINCRYCSKPLGDPFLDLGVMSLANSLLTKETLNQPEFECPLALVLCSNCKLVQLTHVVPPDLMFAHYLYVSGTTKTFQIHFSDYAKKVRSQIKKKTGGVAVDIGSNDGLLLSYYQEEGFKAVGVEPAKNLSDAANQKGLYTINRYFGKEAVDEILKKHGPVSAISANNVFAHIDDVKSVLKNVSQLLDQDGIFVIEFPYLITMYQKLYFDMIYHEHLSYIGIVPLSFFTEDNGLQIFDVEMVSSHGGSLRVFIQKKNGPYQMSNAYKQLLQEEKSQTGEPHKKFAADVLQVKKDLLALIKKIKEEGKSIAGYGAPAKASTIINFCGLTQNEIDFVVDDNPLKQNKYVPGGKIPIVSSDYLTKHPADCVLIFAWNFAPEIMAKIKHSLPPQTKFYTPLPKPQLI